MKFPARRWRSADFVAGLESKMSDERLNKLFQHGAFAKARQVVKQLLAEDPQHQPALIGKARLLILDGHPAQALDILNDILKIEADNAAARTYKAVALEVMGKAQTAEVLLKSATRLDPDFAPARYNLAHHLQAAGKSEEALFQLEQATEIDAENPTYHLRIAELLLELGQDEQAGEVLTALISTFPKFPFGWLLAARAYMNRGEARQALQVLAASADHCPPDAALSIATFQAAAALGDVALCQQAIEVLRHFDQAFSHQLTLILDIVRAKREDDLRKALQAIHPAQGDEIAFFLDTVAAASTKKREKSISLAARTLRKRAQDQRDAPKSSRRR